MQPTLLIFNLDQHPNPTPSSHMMYVSLLWILDICQYILYFLFPLFTSRKTQRDTYQNSYSDHFEFPQYYLLSNNSISHLLQLEPLVFPDYALFSNHDHGYADLSKRLWLCVSKHVGIFNHLFLYRFLLKYYYKYIKL